MYAYVHNNAFNSIDEFGLNALALEAVNRAMNHIGAAGTGGIAGMGYGVCQSLPPKFFSQVNRSICVIRGSLTLQLQREMQIPLPRADDWEDLFWHLAQHGQKGE